MQITFDTKPFATLEADALVSYLFEESDPIQGRISEIDTAAGGLLTKIAGSGEATGKTLEFTLIHAPAGLKAARLLLVGAGKRDQFSNLFTTHPPTADRVARLRAREWAR